MQITVRYYAVDGFSTKRTFALLARAQAFAWKRVGRDAELGSNYAVSSDGIGKITVSGDATLAQVMGRAPEVDPDEAMFAAIEADERAAKAAEFAALALLYPPEPRPFRITDCICSDQQLNLVGCACAASYM